MALKYDFNISQGNNLFIDALVYVNSNISNLLVYAIVFFVGIISLWVYNKTLDDINLSMLYSMFFMIILGILFYYLGILIGTSLFSGVLLIAMILIFASLGGLMYYDRNKLNG